MAQALHLCVIYDEKLRKRLHYYVSRRGSLVTVGTVNTLAMAVWLATAKAKLCHSR